MKKVLYFSYSVIPSYTANSIAVINLCSELDKVCTLKAVCIKNKGDYPSYQEFYGVKSFDIKLIPKFFLKFNYLLYKLYAFYLYNKFKPDVIYSRDIILNEFFCKKKIYNIYEIHQIVQSDIKFNKKFNAILKRIGNSTYLKKIVCISNSLKEECINFGVDSEKLFVSPSGVSNRFFTKNSIKYEKKVLYLGSIQKGKGINNITNLAVHMPGYIFYVVGGNSEQLSTYSNIVHIPWVKPSKVVEYIKNIPYAIMLFDNQDYKFHSPLKLFEYLAMGKIIIAGMTVGIDEVIVDGYNGFLVNSTDVNLIADKIMQIDKNLELKKRIAANAKKTAQKYKYSNKVRELKKIL